MNKNDFYDSGYYAGFVPEPRFKEVLKIVKGVNGKKLLDIGCGDGGFTVALKDALGAEEVVGIEIAAEAIKTLESKGIKACKLDVDEEMFPFKDAYFDVIYCGEVIEHLFNPDHMLQEIYRVLKPAGICIITTPNLAGWPSRLALLLGYQPYPTAVSPTHESAGKLIIKGDEGQWGHIRVFTLKALKELVNIYGENSHTGEKPHVVVDLMRKAIAYPDFPFTVWGDGKQTRDFLHVLDCVDALIKLEEKAANPPVIVNIGSGKATSIETLAEEIIRISGKDIKIIYDTTKPVGPLSRTAEIKKAKNAIGWEPKIGLEEGLGRTYKWLTKVVDYQNV